MHAMDPAADEFSLLHENASEFGLPWPAAPIVRRDHVALPGGGTVSALVWDGAADDERAPIVFLHGTAMNAHTWDTVALALDRPLVAFDLPGHGRSSWRQDSDYSPSHLAASVGEAMDQWSLGGSTVVGMSLGGATALAMAGERPDLVGRLVLVDITPAANRRKAQAILEFVNGPQTFPSFDAILARTVEHNPTRSEPSLRRGILHNAHRLEDGSWAWNYDRRGRAQPDATTLPEEGTAPALAPLWDVIGGLRVPLLLVRGGRSPIVDDDDVAELLRRRPDAEVITVEGAGHSIQGDRPVELATIIDRFVASTGS